MKKKIEAIEKLGVGKRAGGVYIPPQRFAMLQRDAEGLDKNSESFQKLNWESLRKKINGLVNKVNISNIKEIVFEVFKMNIIRGRGLLCRSLIKSQSVSPSFTPVYAALVAIINSKIPDIGHLLLVRLINVFKKAFRRNDKKNLLSSTKFIGHLFNQYVLNPLVPMEIFVLLLNKPTDDSVEICVHFMQEIAIRLNEVMPKGYNGIFDRLRSILHEGDADKRVQYLIEGLFGVRRQEFRDFPAIPEDLDLVEEGDQNMHVDLSLDQDLNLEENLDYFQLDLNFVENEVKFEKIKKEILGDSDEEDSESEESSESEEGDVPVEDRTGAQLLKIKKEIYLAIMSSLTFSATAHKLLKMNFEEEHVSKMIVECCAQEKTFLRSYALIAERFCVLRRTYREKFAELFESQYATIYRYETNKLRNVAKFFAYLLYRDAIPWSVLKAVRLTSLDTTSSSRIFLKILFLELAADMSVAKLDMKLKEPELQPYLTGVFPKDNLKNTTFAINYFTTINLGLLTEDMRNFLANAPKTFKREESSDSDSDSDSDSSSDSSDSSSDSSDSSSDSSDSSSSDSSDSSSSSSSDSRRRSRRRYRSR